MRGGLPSPYPLPSRERGSFDRLRMRGGFNPHPSPLPSRERGSFDRLRMRGGLPSPYPLPSRERGSFDRLRMRGGFTLTPALSHWERGSFGRLRMRGGFTLTPALSRQGGGCAFDRLRTNGMDRIWAVAGYGIAVWLTGSKKWVIILKTPVSRHECIAHMGR